MEEGLPIGGPYFLDEYFGKLAVMPDPEWFTFDGYEFFRWIVDHIRTVARCFDLHKAG
jgi:hypothetical protein